MRPTLRPAMAVMTRLLSRLRPARRGSRPSQARGLVPEVDGLEDRMLMYFSPSTATAVPKTLWPPNGRYVPVVLSGTFREFTVINNKTIFELLPGPKQARFMVVDEYHLDEPSGPVHLTNLGHGNFSYSFTIHLQASRANQFPAGRRYYITVGAADNNGWSGQTIPVQVPLSLTDRGPGPQVGQPTHHKGTLIHPKG
jgi:hypothetical protein